MDDKKQDFKQNLKSYVSDEDIAHSDNYFQSSSVESVDDVNNVSDAPQSQSTIFTHRQNTELFIHF